MATVTMTMEEYLQLLNGLNGNIQTEVSEVPVLQDKPKPRRKKNPKLKRALTEDNRRMSHKRGTLRKGKTQADVMRLASRLLKKT